MTEYIKKVRAVVVNGEEYASMGEAGREFNLHKTTVANRCNSDNFPNWTWQQ